MSITVDYAINDLESYVDSFEGDLDDEVNFWEAIKGYIEWKLSTIIVD